MYSRAPSGGGLLAATERLFQRVIWSAHNQCTSLASMRSNAVWCIRPSRLSRSLNQVCLCELRWNWTSTQFGVDFRETTVLIEASVHVGTFSGVPTDKLQSAYPPFRFIAERRNDFRPQPKVVWKFVADLRPKPKGRRSSTLVFFRRRSRTLVGL